MVKKKKGTKRRNNRESSPSDEGLPRVVPRRIEHNSNLLNNTAGSSNTKTRRVVPERREFALVIAEDEADTTRNMSWQSLNPGPSSYLPRHFCCVCGFEAAQRCPTCSKNRPHAYTRFICSPSCTRIHLDTDCCKQRQWCGA